MVKVDVVNPMLMDFHRLFQVVTSRDNKNPLIPIYMDWWAIQSCTLGCVKIKKMHL